MAEARDAVREVRLRPVEDQDLGVFFEHQADPEANEMAAFPARGKDQFAAHWARVRADDTSVLRTTPARSGCWRSAPSGGIGCRRRRRRNPTTASRSSSSCSTCRPAASESRAASAETGRRRGRDVMSS
jgi:hypothetical protein